jgi:hypothetical protein
MSCEHDINALRCPFCGQRWSALYALVFLAVMVSCRPTRRLRREDEVCPPCFRCWRDGGYRTRLSA